MVTLLVSLRWGAMIGLIVFVFALMAGAIVISRLSPPTAAVTAGALVMPAGAERAPPSDRTLNAFQYVRPETGCFPTEQINDFKGLAPKSGNRSAAASPIPGFIGPGRPATWPASRQTRP